MATFNGMGKDELKTMLLVTSFYLLSCSLETHSESTDEGSNSSYVWAKWVCVLFSHPLSYLIVQDTYMYLPLLVEGLWRIALIFWPVSTFDLSRKFKVIYVYTGVIKKKALHEVRWDEVGAFFTVCLWAILLSTLFQMKTNTSRMK